MKYILKNKYSTEQFNNLKELKGYALNKYSDYIYTDLHLSLKKAKSDEFINDFNHHMRYSHKVYIERG